MRINIIPILIYLSIFLSIFNVYNVLQWMYNNALQWIRTYFDSLSVNKGGMGNFQFFFQKGGVDKKGGFYKVAGSKKKAPYN